MALQKSIFTNPQFVQPWRAACAQAVRDNPNEEAALYLQFAFNRVSKLHFSAEADLRQSAADRREVFKCFHQASASGDARGMFFEGLALLDGYGCTPDRIGQDWIKVAAYGRKCDLALDYYARGLGLMYLCGKGGVAQSFAHAIKYLSRAGAIAIPELQVVQAHVAKMQARVSQVAVPDSNIVALEPGRLRLSAAN